MWILLGVAAIITAILNIIFFAAHKETKYLRFASLSLTALTVCSFYYDAAQRVIKEDWSGLMDILPTMSKALWVCVILSILINCISLFSRSEKKL